MPQHFCINRLTQSCLRQRTVSVCILGALMERGLIVHPQNIFKKLQPVLHRVCLWLDILAQGQVIDLLSGTHILIGASHLDIGDSKGLHHGPSWLRSCSAGSLLLGEKACSVDSSSISFFCTAEEMVSPVCLATW